MSNLWFSNHPRNFWLCQPDFPEDVWQEAVVRATPILSAGEADLDLDAILEWTLGEGQFGPNRYRFGFARRVYYALKPFLSQKVTHLMRRIHSDTARKASILEWPIEPRYARFQWEILRQALLIVGKAEVDFRYFWPDGKQFAFVLTHDVETADGQRDIPLLADMEEAMGFRSSFNFVPERYRLDLGLMADLKRRGFEIGVHGLRHDSKLFSSYPVFAKQVIEINRYVREFQAEGFRAPYTHRNPHWMQLLDVQYDLSFFDTDPFEPMPGGAMSIWPFRIGRFLELPYTLPQDSTLFNVLGKTSHQIWTDKISFIKKYHGMALMLVHPDYSGKGIARQAYESFLEDTKAGGGYWHALPGQVAAWWKSRPDSGKESVSTTRMARVALLGDSIDISV
jgi:peptidoglycan/xylan/chitin deacetylase (PgdA/CDA1 family)